MTTPKLPDAQLERLLVEEEVIEAQVRYNDIYHKLTVAAEELAELKTKEQVLIDAIRFFPHMFTGI